MNDPRALGPLNGHMLFLQGKLEHDPLEAIAVGALETYQPEDFSDAGNAKNFARFADGHLLWANSRGWLAWNGKNWEPNEHAAVGLGVAFTEQMLQEAKAMLDYTKESRISVQAAGGDGLTEARAKEARAEKYLSFAVKTRSRQRVDGFLALSKPSLHIPDERLDSDPFLLNSPAGIVDLRTGKIRRHDPAAYCTSITAVAPSDQGDEIWNSHLRTITEDDSELMRFHQETAGMMLLGRVFCENLLIAIGGGRNGKSTHYNALMAVMGSGYAGTLNPDVLTSDKQNAGADLAALKGKRLVVAAELEEGRRLSIGILKRLSSTDPISAERKYYDPETFVPSHSTVLYTNHMPRLGSLDEGTRRRILVIPFGATISTDGEIKNYGAYLFENAGGAILAWAVEGARMFIESGYKFSPCRVVDEATGRYFSANDWMQQFLDEACILGPGRKCAAAALYHTYADRANKEGEYVRRNNDFAAELEKRGFAKTRASAGYVWNGIDIRPGWQGEHQFSPQSAP